MTTCSCLHIYQSTLSSIFYLSVCQEPPPYLPPHHTLSFVPKIAHRIVFCLCVATCLFLSDVPASVLHPSLHTHLSDNAAFCLVIHPSSNTFPRAVHLSSFTQQKLSPPGSSFLPPPPPSSLPFSSLPCPLAASTFCNLPSCIPAHAPPTVNPTQTDRSDCGHKHLLPLFLLHLYLLRSQRALAPQSSLS